MPSSDPVRTAVPDAPVPVVWCSAPEAHPVAARVAERADLGVVSARPAGGTVLVVEPTRVGLWVADGTLGGPVWFDLAAEAAARAREPGMGRKGHLSRALGAHKRRPHVLDATAGLGRDAVAAAVLGCTVTACERNPWLAALWPEALAYLSAANPAVAARLTFSAADARDVLAAHEPWFDVVYADPMFPGRKKSALVKKELRAVRAFVGGDPDATALCVAARQAAPRVVVKRPKLAPELDGPPSLVVGGKAVRYDVYLQPPQDT